MNADALDAIDGPPACRRHPPTPTRPRRRPPAGPPLVAVSIAVLWTMAVASPVVRAQSGGEGTPPPPGAAAVDPEIESQTSLLDLYRQGGWLMHVLLLLSVGTIAVAAYCGVQISEKKMIPPGLQESLVRHMRQRDITNAYHLCQENPSSFTRVVSAALLKCNFERDRANKASMEQAAGETLEQEETRYMLWINYLNVFATIAPMVGLLGTVLGMIEAFSKLASGQSEPSDLAAGIGQAMVTTAAGLIVGIPAMFFFFYFRNKLMAIVSKIQRDVTFLIDVLSGEVKLEGDEPSRSEEAAA